MSGRDENPIVSLLLIRRESVMVSMSPKVIWQEGKEADGGHVEYCKFKKMQKRDITIFGNVK